MGRALFYHLTQSSAEDLVRRMAPRAFGQGWRVVLRGRDRAQLERLDERLWLVPEESFLPHGLDGGPHDADQPLLLTDAAGLPTGTQALMAIDGAPVTPEEVAQLERVWIIFDGLDNLALDVARHQWRSLTQAGCAAEYWNEAGGGWEKKAEHPKPEA